MEQLVIRGVRILDGRRMKPIEDGALVAEGGRISYVGPARLGPPVGGGARVIEASGKTLIPGLIDCHVHLCFDGTGDFPGEVAALNLSLAALKAARNAGRWLEAGVTTVRDLGGYKSAVIEVARAQRLGIVVGPRILAAGEVLTITGGQGHFIGKEVDNADEIVRGVRELVKAGADLIKIIASGGILTPGVSAQRSAFTVEEIAAATQEAHEANRRVAAHAIGERGIVAALRAGVDSIEHGCFLSDEALKLFKETGAWLVATLVAPHAIIEGGEQVPEYALRKAEEVRSTHVESFRRALESGVRMAAGTDAGTPFNIHGELTRELRLMHENGMPLEDVLASATREAAALLDLDNVGTLEEGREADAVLVDGDPLTDIGAFERVILVVQGGRIVVDHSDGSLG